jgi:hypothetical protein
MPEDGVLLSVAAVPQSGQNFGRISRFRKKKHIRPLAGQICD